jgi:hypothetical protein
MTFSFSGDDTDHFEVGIIFQELHEEDYGSSFEKVTLPQHYSRKGAAPQQLIREDSDSVLGD